MSRPAPVVLQAQSLIASGRAREAAALLDRHARLRPRDGHAGALLGLALAIAGDHERAGFLARRAAQEHPQDPTVQSLCGSALGVVGDAGRAIAAYRAALTAEPTRLEALEGLATLLVMQQRHHEVGELARRGLALTPSDAVFTGLLASSLSATGRARESLRLIESALARAPEDRDLLYARAATMNYVPDLDPTAIAEAHRRFGRAETLAAGEPLSPLPPRRASDARGAGAIRVGFMSGDLRSHSCAHFLGPLLRHLDRSTIEPLAFSTNARRDAITDELRGLFASWDDLHALGDRAAAELIRARGTDVLIDLSGLSAGERLGVMALRAAPVQATYLGYPNTTGLESVGWRIVDAVTDPDGFERRCAERLLRLGRCFVCFGPIGPKPPEPAPRPADAPVVFASFNVLSKLSEETVELWARVVNAAPRSSLLLKAAALAHDEARREMQERFAIAGLSAERLTLLGWVDEDPLRTYQRADVALDPFPYNGTTTTCEALWMGLPVVTLAGGTHAGRVGASLLTHLGKTEWVAPDPASYVRIAVGLANDPAARAAWRGRAREAVRATIGNGEAFAREFERAITSVWSDYLKGGVA
ncbi:MAG: glycosyltransferase [Phycisphaerae bacterium]|nr:glycosyltransferase [Phycisphaerae bacterium]